MRLADTVSHHLVDRKDLLSCISELKVFLAFCKQLVRETPDVECKYTGKLNKSRLITTHLSQPKTALDVHSV
jgi:hypothetical protein